MVNWSGLAGVVATLGRPGLIVPHLVVPSIESLSWTAAKAHGVRYVVFDKDNCLTRPHSDQLAPQLTQSYQDCLRVFGHDNVLIVSNSAGSSSDIGGIGAQHLSRMLFGTTVLCHPAKKPAKACATQVVDYFTGVGVSRTSARSPLRRLFAAKPTQGSEGSAQEHVVNARPGDVLVVGDRITTDVVLSHRIADVLTKRYNDSSASPLPSPRSISILTTHLWAQEGILNTLMRRAEAAARTRLVKRGIQPGQSGWSAQTTTPAITYTHLLSPAPSSASIPLSQLPRRSPTPTITTLAISSIYATRLPLLLKRGVALLLSNRLWTSTTHFFSDGWHLILRGIREGLNRPEVVFGRSVRSHDDKSPRAASPAPRTFPSLFGIPPRARHHQQHRFYSSSSSGSGSGKRRPSPYAYAYPSSPSSSPSYKQQQRQENNRKFWKMLISGLIMIPGSFYIGVHINEWIYGPEEIQSEKDDPQLELEAERKRYKQLQAKSGHGSDAEEKEDGDDDDDAQDEEAVLAALKELPDQQFIMQKNQLLRELEGITRKMKNLQRRIDEKGEDKA